MILVKLDVLPIRSANKGNWGCRKRSWLSSVKMVFSPNSMKSKVRSFDSICYVRNEMKIDSLLIANAIGFFILVPICREPSISSSFTFGRCKTTEVKDKQTKYDYFVAVVVAATLFASRDGAAYYSVSVC